MRAELRTPTGLRPKKLVMTSDDVCSVVQCLSYM